MRLTKAKAEGIFGKLKFKRGLVTAVIRDSKSKEVLMVAFQNRQAVLRTLIEGNMFYWSRSRRKLWLKGEESGHYQRLRKVRVDCDGDAVLYDVVQIGEACHEGYPSCFYREFRAGKLVKTARRKFRPANVYKRR